MQPRKLNHEDCQCDWDTFSPSCVGKYFKAMPLNIKEKRGAIQITHRMPLKFI